MSSPLSAIGIKPRSVNKPTEINSRKAEIQVGSAAGLSARGRVCGKPFEVETPSGEAKKAVQTQEESFAQRAFERPLETISNAFGREPRWLFKKSSGIWRRRPLKSMPYGENGRAVRIDVRSFSRRKAKSGAREDVRSLCRRFLQTARKARLAKNPQSRPKN
ncbi:uncharacterized protein BKA78DRAFT_58140 [Phyllosticta capitalensis]|uniref:uncharacterized protein n=1 Tax=Phyllosticta capitalensis TaxID=121624 RepID=UPI003131AD89